MKTSSFSIKFPSVILMMALIIFCSGQFLLGFVFLGIFMIAGFKK